MVVFNAKWKQQVLCDPLFKLVSKQQKFLGSVFERFKRTRLCSLVEDNNSYWLDSCSSSNGWLNCIPNSRYGTSMDCTDFRLALRLRIRDPIFDSDAHCRKSGSPKIDPLGHHAIGCPINAGPTRRHNHVAKVVFLEAVHGLLEPRYDPKQLLSDSHKKPADVFIPNWRNCQPIALDISIVVPTRKNRGSSSTSAENKQNNCRDLMAVDDAYDAKIEKHRSDCHKMGMLFEPLLLDASGFIHENSRAV